jgi:hypothetical protein
MRYPPSYTYARAGSDFFPALWETFETFPSSFLGFCPLPHWPIKPASQRQVLSTRDAYIKHTQEEDRKARERANTAQLDSVAAAEHERREKQRKRLALKLALKPLPTVAAGGSHS